MTREIRFIVARDRMFYPGQNLRMSFYEQLPGGKVFSASAINMAEHDPASPIPDAGVLPLTEEAGQQLIDQLWDAGVRPSKSVLIQPALDQAEAHLADLRQTTLWAQETITSLVDRKET